MSSFQDDILQIKKPHHIGGVFYFSLLIVQRSLDNEKNFATVPAFFHARQPCLGKKWVGIVGNFMLRAFH